MQSVKIKNRYALLLLVAVVVVIEYLATTSRSIEIVQSVWDKLNHLNAFIVVSILLAMSISMSRWVYFLSLLIYAVHIEVVQFFLPKRYFSIEDIVADMIGVAIGYTVLQAYYKLKRLR